MPLQLAELIEPPRNGLVGGILGSSTISISPSGAASIASGSISNSLISADASLEASKSEYYPVTPLGSGTPRTVQSKLSDFLSVKDFGAKGDSITDDTAAFQAAYDKAPGNSQIQVPEGWYKMDGAIDVSSGKKLTWNCMGAFQADGVTPLRLPGVQCFQRGQYLYRQVITAPDDDAVVEIQRPTFHTGGTPGFVTPGLKVSSRGSAGAKNYEWTILALLTNNSTWEDQSENVGIYSQATKNSDGKTWAACFEIRDFHTANPAKGNCIGLEMSLEAQPLTSDENYQRNGIHCAVKTATSDAAEWSRCYWATTEGGSRIREVFSNRGVFTKAVLFNEGNGEQTGIDTPYFIWDKGSSTVGINLSQATYNTGVALQLNTGHKIAFDPSNSTTLGVSNSLLTVTGVPFAPTGGLSFTSAQSSNSASAGSGTLPNAPAGFVSITVNGAAYKVPYYNA